MTVADLITGILKTAGHEVLEVTADAASKDTLTTCDALLLGSPSWEDEGKDGQPLPEVRHFVETLTSSDLANKKIAIFGLGDTSYPHFCGAVDVLEALLKEKSASVALPSLRIDRHYSSPDNEAKVKEWANQCAIHFPS